MADKDFFSAKRKKGESLEEYSKRLKEQNARLIENLKKSFKREEDPEDLQEFSDRYDVEEYKRDKENTLKPGEFRTKDGRRFEQHIKSGGSVKKNYVYGGRVAKMSVEKS